MDWKTLVTRLSRVRAALEPVEESLLREQKAQGLDFEGTTDEADLKLVSAALSELRDVIGGLCLDVLNEPEKVA